MANFVEAPSLPLAPYTPSVDLGVMSNALRFKQNQYDTNVQRIQSTIDSVNGLDVYRNVDKQYLQDKVNTLTTNLNQIGGSDFSGNSIVSQAIGMAAPIYKDPNVQAAVASTADIRAHLADRKQLQDKHPELYSADNEWYDNQAINKYAQSPKLGERYQGSREATKYFDWQKPIKEALDDLGPAISYKINSDGKFQYFIEKDSTVKPSDVENIVNGIIGRDPRIQKQIGISALYTYKDHDAVSLASHIGNFYNQQIAKNASLLQYYEDQLQEDPTNPNLQEKVANFKADTYEKINNLNNEKQNYIGLFASGANLDQLKQTFFNDGIRKSYVYQFQQDDKELDIKTNETAKQTSENFFKNENLKIARSKLGIDQVQLRLQMIAQGTDPDNGLAISWDNPKHMQEFIDANAKSLGLDGSWSIGKGTGTGTGTGAFGPNGGGTTVPGAEAKIYTQKSNSDRIASLQTDLATAETNLMKDYEPLTNYRYGTPEFKAAFDAWKDKQEQHLRDHDGLALDQYTKYKHQLQQDKALKGALEATEKDITQAAYDQYKFGNIDKKVKIDDLAIETPSGTKKTLEFNLKDHPDFALKFKKFYQEARNNIENLLHTNDILPDENSEPEIYKAANDIVKKLADTYKNDPDYNIIKAFANKGLKKLEEGRQEILAPVDNVLAKRQEYIDNEFEKKGEKLTYRTTIFKGKPELLTEAKSLIIGSIKSDKANNEIAVDPESITPVDGYMDDKGQAFVRYIDKTAKKGTAGGDLKVVKVANDRAIFGNPDPYQKLEYAINASPNNTTPTKGDGVLISQNGRVRYAIHKNNTDHTYSLYILDDHGMLVPAAAGYDETGKPRPSFTNINDVINQVDNNISIIKDPQTGKMLTPQQIIEIAKNSYQKYK